jgi:hypothetical protein
MAVARTEEKRIIDVYANIHSNGMTGASIWLRSSDAVAPILKIGGPDYSTYRSAD